MLKTIQNENRYWRIFFIITLIFAIDSAFIPGNSRYWAVMGILFADILFLRKEIRLGWLDLLIFLGTSSIYWICDHNFFSGLDLGLKSLVVFQIGKNFAYPWNCDNTKTDTDSDNAVERVAVAVLALSMALFLKGLLNYSYMIFDPSAIVSSEWAPWRFQLPVWNAGSYSDISDDTYLFFHLVLISSLIPYYALIIRKSRLLAVVGITLSSLAILLGTIGTGKFGIVCSIITGLIVAMMIMVEKKWFKNIRIWMLIVGGLDILMIIAVIAVGFNIWSFNDSEFYRVRLEAQGAAISLFPEYPLGGYDNMIVVQGVGNVYQAYNSWLDIAVKAGVIPFAIFTVILSVLIVMLRYIWTKSDNPDRYVLICSFVQMTLFNMLVSGYLRGDWHWNIEIFLGGLICGLYGNISGKEGLVICSHH